MSNAQREWFERDYYKVLGVSSGASKDEIRKAYRKLSKELHPDSGGDEERFKEVSAAYDVLGDEAKRKEYDEVRRLGPMGNPFGGGGNPFAGFGGAGGGGAGPGGFRVDDITDLLGGVFNRGAGRGGRPGTRATGPRKGDDLETELHLSFEDAINGVETTVNVTSDAACTNCGGTGAAPGTSPVICSTCGGRGVRDENQGLFSFSQPCRDCKGTGMRIETPCKDCRGSGIVRRPRQIKVRIPPGVADAQRIRLKGRGAVGANGGPPGDLFVTVRVGGHKLFGRKGKDLTLTVPVTYPEAALGATVTVPTLDSTVTLRIPAGTPTGKTFRVRGRGAPVTGGFGDLLVTVEVNVPSKLTDAERAAVEQLAAFTESPRKHLTGE